MVHNQATNFRSLAARLVFGSIAPALATLAFFGLHLASTAFAFVIAIVPAPLMGSFSAERYLPSCRWRASIGFRSADLLIPDCYFSWRWPAALLTSSMPALSNPAAVGGLITLRAASKEND
jgi:hypothetical protein